MKNVIKKNLVIMGSHPNGSAQFNWDRKDCDIWLFNEAPMDTKYKRCDAVFQLHDEAIWKSPKNRSNEKHYQWLSSGKTPKIYMQKKFKDVPKSVRYPIEKVLKLSSIKCLTSTPDLALALVALEKKYQKVEIWGIELETESEYSNQRLGFGFWTGYLSALGIKLEIHSSVFTAPIYGYEGDIAITPNDIRARIKELEKNMGDDYKQEAELLLERVKELYQEDISLKVQQKLKEITINYEAQVITDGQIAESKRYLEKAIAMQKKAGSSVFSMGEFDGTRIDFSQQYTQMRIETQAQNAKLNVLMKNALNLKPMSKARISAVDEFGVALAELMNKNVTLLNLIGRIRENQYYFDNSKLSFERTYGN
jgi:hypothetical protein